MERADLSQATLDNAQLLGVKMLCANLEGASLRCCNFEDPAGTNANMEGALHIVSGLYQCFFATISNL